MEIKEKTYKGGKKCSLDVKHIDDKKFILVTNSVKLKGGRKDGA
mgnify:CR=1 FL=1